MSTACNAGPIRLLADDLTGALDSAAAFGADVPVHLAHPPTEGTAAPVEVVATASRDEPTDTLPALLAPCDTPWAIGASHQPVTRRQWQQAAAAWPQAQQVRHGDVPALAQAIAALAAQPAQPALLDLSPLAPMSPAEAAMMLQAQAERLAQLQRPARLLVLGGDTALALARATGVVSLRTGQPLRPGWGRAQWCGGRWDGLWMEARSGAFGPDDDLLAALAQASGRSFDHDN